MRTAVDTAWSKASDAQKGNFAGATVAAQKAILTRVGAIAAQVGCTLPNKPASVPNYYGESAELKNVETRFVDDAEAIHELEACLPADQKQSTGSKVLHSEAVGIASGLHTEFWGKGKRDRAKLQDQTFALYGAGILAAASVLSQYLPGSAPGASTARVPEPAPAAAPGSSGPPSPPIAGTAGDFFVGPRLPYASYPHALRPTS